MPLDIYSGNKTNTGGALFVSFSSKDGSFFFKVLKQTGWNDQTKKASFSGGEIMNLKFGRIEVGSIIRAINRQESVSKPFFHPFNGVSTSISFNYYEKAYTDKQGKPDTMRGFSFSFKRNESLIRIGVSLGDAEVLSRYLEFGLDHIFSAIYAKDKKEFEEYLKKRNNEKNVPVGKRDTKDELPDVDPIPDPSAPPELVAEGTPEDVLDW